MTAGAHHSQSRAGRCIVRGRASGPLLRSDTPLSFWGGVDAASGRIIDAHHPLHGETLTGKVLAIPGSRGSCSGSGVLLELILNGHAPAALVFSRAETILTLGVLVAEAMFERSIPVAVLLPEDFSALEHQRFAAVRDGEVSAAMEPVDWSYGAAPERMSTAHRSAVALTRHDRDMLDGKLGRAAEVAMRIIVRMAELQGAERLIEVRQAHIDGCVYTGPAGLRFARELCELGGKVAVPTSLNAISVDAQRWRAQGVDEAFALAAIELGMAYVRMGARPTFTCAPYQLDTAPFRGEDIAWAESNAVVYANSVLGARTAKYPDFLDACIALTGRAPLADCHVEANRRATVQVDLAGIEDVDDSFYPLLGYHVGGLVGDRIPVIVGLETARPRKDDLRAFAAAFATTSGAAMFHVAGVTPEAPGALAARGGLPAAQVIEVSRADLQTSWRELNTAESSRIDLVSLGNPHFSAAECARAAEILRGKRKHDGVALVIACNRETYRQAHADGVAQALEAFGAEFVTDTCWCMIGEPIIQPAARTIMTNSAKYAHYGPGLTGRAFRFGSLEDCLGAACGGLAPGEAPNWLLDR
jgi:cis-L-3-hydroxyproline dehydratase